MAHGFRHGGVRIHITEPILAQGTEWSDKLLLRNKARKAILEHLDEPDLNLEKSRLMGKSLRCQSQKNHPKACPI